MIENSAFFKLGYGLYVLTVRDAEKDNGCIINTAMQLTSTPQRILLSVNKANYTNEVLLRTGLCNINTLTTQTPFSVFEHFGFQSGRTVNKFAECATETRSENGLIVLPKYTNACLSAKVVDTYDYGTHTLFIADVTEAKVLSDETSVTYQYYQDNIKPKLQPAAKKGWVCKICGYVYEGETLPPDFICPLCKHGAEDFERIQ